jgi:hypothetical protein
MAQQRTRSKTRKRRAQRRPATDQAKGAARNRRHDITAKRRRRTAEDPEAVARIAGTPKGEAKGGRPRNDPNNRAKSKIYAPRVALGKGGRPRSPRLRERIARRAA